MIIALFIFAIMFILCAAGTIFSVVIDNDDGIVLCGGLTLIIGIAMSVVAMVQFAMGG